MLTKEFTLKIFEGFSIERWNDLVRPFDLIEMDKAAEKNGFGIFNRKVRRRSRTPY